MYCAYVLQNPGGILYKGHTDDLQKRIEQHNAEDGFHSYTKHRGPWTVVYTEEFPTRKEAMMREKFFKTGKGRGFLKRIIGAVSA
ncbi:GIY-YIG nuclease family protein [Candidatus Peregrinibacteria bacterium]|nr:GIY-YIG nuclease family protein [Candidatus Peregrinibacteria bacterium]